MRLIARSIRVLVLMLLTFVPAIASAHAAPACCRGSRSYGSRSHSSRSYSSRSHSPRSYSPRSSPRTYRAPRSSTRSYRAPRTAPHRYASPHVRTYRPRHDRLPGPSSRTRAYHAPRPHRSYRAPRAPRAPGSRNAHGRLARSRTARSRFERQTGHPHGWPGHVIDHIVPLACGGRDSPDNMQWQTTAEAKAKDRVERRGCR